MGVYRMEIAGRKKPVLLRADNKTAAIDRVVLSAKALTGGEVEELLESGESVWKPGEPFPADEVEAPAGATVEEGAD